MFYLELDELLSYDFDDNLDSERKTKASLNSLVFTTLKLI